MDNRIQAVEEEIRKAEGDIQAATDELARATDKDDKDYWSKEKDRLRKEQEQLRKEKEQLREEKLIALRAATGGGSGGGGATDRSPARPLHTDGDGGWTLLSLAVGLPLLFLALVVNHGVNRIDDATQCVKAFVSRNDPALAATFKGVRGVGFVESVSQGVAAAAGACLRRLKLHRVKRSMEDPKPSEQGPDLSSASRA